MLWILSDFKDCEQLPRDDLELVDAGVQTEDISDEVDAKVTRDQQTQTEEVKVEEESESHVKVILIECIIATSPNMLACLDGEPGVQPGWGGSEGWLVWAAEWGDEQNIWIVITVKNQKLL